MNHRIINASIALVILLPGPLWAHHSGRAVFDFSKALTLTGTLTKVDWRNPHIEVSLEAEGDRGQVETWVMEEENRAPRFLPAPIDPSNKRPDVLLRVLVANEATEHCVNH